MLSSTDPRSKEVADLARYGQQVLVLHEPTDTQPLRFQLELALNTTTKRPVWYWYVTRPVELDAVVRWLSTQRMVAFDLETSGLNAFDANIATLQLGSLDSKEGEPNAVVIDVRAFNYAELQDVFKVLEDRSVTKLGQNVRFEYRFLRAHYGVRCRGLADTQVAEMVIRAGLLSPKDQARGKGEERTAYKLCSMASLMERYSGIEIDKAEDLRTSFYKTPVGQHSLRQVVYAASDVIYPFVIAKEQRKLIEERGLRGIIKVEMELIPVLGELEHRGMRIDKSQWRALWQEALAKRAEAQAALDELIRKYTMQADLFDTSEHKERPLYPKANRYVNYSSSEQVKWVLKQICKGRNWTHEVVTDMDRLNQLKAEYGKSWLHQQEDRGRAAKVEDVPDWLIPEDQYCVLTEADKNTLTLRKCRAQLPADVVDLLIEYSKYDIRCDTFGNDWLLKNVRADSGRIHCEVHQAVTNTGRLSTTPNCYDSATEILTRRGWVMFSDLAEDDAVAQVHPDTMAIDFVVPTDRYAGEYTGPMWHWTSEQIDLLVTPHHRMLVEMRNGKKEVIRADAWVSDRKHYHSGIYAGGASPLTPAEVRFLVAAQADASWACGGLDFSFRKQRKVMRLHMLLAELGETADWKESSRRSRIRLSKTARMSDLARRYLGSAKQFGPWILDLSREALTAFVEEVWYWDGSSVKRSQYCSTDRVNAEWVAIACALSGVRARLRPYKEGYAWHVDTRWKPYSWTTGVSATTVDYSGRVYCVTVPTGMVLVRRKRFDGRYVMSVSGNTQNVPSDARYRNCFIPADGFSFVIADYSQQEPRLLAQVSKDPVYLNTYTNNDDLYLSVAEAMLGHRPDKHTPEGKLERKIFKAVVLAMAYRSGARKLRDQLTLGLADAIVAGDVPAPSFEYAASLHSRFFEIHEQVLEYQNYCSTSADPKNKTAKRLWDQVAGDMVTYIRSPCGRLRFFPPDAKNTYTEAANAPIQSGSATMTKAAACLIQRVIDDRGWQSKAFIVNLVHDEILCEVQDDIAAEFAPLMRECMEEAGRFYCPDVPIVAEFPEGTNGVVKMWAK